MLRSVRPPIKIPRPGRPYPPLIAGHKDKCRPTRSWSPRPGPGPAQLFLSWDENWESRLSGHLGPPALDDQPVDAEVIQFRGRRLGSQGSITRTHPGCSVKAACRSRR